MQHEPPTTDRERELQGQSNTTTQQSPQPQGHLQQPGMMTPEATQVVTPAAIPATPPQQAPDPANELAIEQATGTLNSAASTPADVQQRQQYQVPQQPNPQNYPGESTDIHGQEYRQSGTLNLHGKTEGTLLDDTMQELQLRSQPFIGSSAEGELFADEVTFSQINEIKQAIIKGETVLVLTGEEGAGKTTLLKQLTRNSGTRLQFFSVKGGEKYTTHNLFSGILDAWKLTPPAEFEDSTNEMLRALQANQERNTTVVLLLDDADLIPAKELHLLLATVQYFNGDAQLLRVILAAQPQFESQLPQMLPQGLKLPYSAMQVEPMLASRAAPYIQLRLNQAGHFDEFPLSEKQVSSIANDASGYPGRINFLAAEALNAMYCPFTDTRVQGSTGGFFSRFFKSGRTTGQATPGTEKKVKASAMNGKTGKALATLFGIGLIAAGIYSTNTRDKSDDNSVAGTENSNDQSTGNNAASNSEFKTVETRPVGTKPAAVSNETAADNAEATAGETTRLEQVSSAAANAAGNAGNTEAQATPDVASGAAGNTVASATMNTPKVSVANTAANATAANSASNADNNTQATGHQDQSGSAEAEAELQAAASELSAALGTSTSSETRATTAAAEPATAAANAEAAVTTESATGKATLAESSAAEKDNSTGATAVDAAADTTDTNAEMPGPATESATLSAEAKVANTETDANGDNVNGLESPNWVLLQEAELFTIQMSASTDRSDITRFLQAANLQKPTSIYSFKRGETTWYALVQGLYKDLGEARNAIKGMNKAAVKNQPWIRKLGSIQNSLKK